MERIRVGIRRFLGFINQYSGQPLQEEDNSESAPTANPLSFSRPQILKIGMCAFHFAGFVTLMTGLKSGLQECKSLFPEIELPKNATQDFINKIDDKDYLRHNCEQKSIETVVYSAIGFHGCLSILDLMVRKFCLSSLGLGN